MWIEVEDQLPPEGVYVLTKVNDDDIVGITNLVDGEWDTEYRGKRPVFEGAKKYYTSAEPQYWKPIPV